MNRRVRTLNIWRYLEVVMSSFDFKNEIAGVNFLIDAMYSK